MGKIMLLTSQYTGRGHMSIAEALMEHFERMKDLTVDVVDGFIFMGRQGVTNSKIYNVITRRAKFIWKAASRPPQVGDFVPPQQGVSGAEAAGALRSRHAAGPDSQRAPHVRGLGHRRAGAQRAEHSRGVSGGGSGEHPFRLVRRAGGQDHLSHQGGLRSLMELACRKKS